ncbi:DUF3302 domain-containing protein [Maridesulfovibrio sp.]|uniref:DUF3302 domain-containing protein n=1 Tax=Maridesulfovibrio sp. TaxID=2795000 RepID=UPI0029C9BC4F|nr:DUF3302 domain-containing protein [Maridesulfovibrio sp.]
MVVTDSRILDYVGAGMLIFVFLVLVYGIIYIHDIPYNIAKKRNHPHQDAIHAAGWVSLFTLHAIWPFLWIWAMVHKPDLESDTTFVEHEAEAAVAEEAEPDAKEA